MTRQTLAALGTTLGVLAILTLFAWPGEAARPDLIRPVLRDLRQFDTMYLSGRHEIPVDNGGFDNTVWVYAAGDGRVTIDMSYANLRYSFDGQAVLEDSDYTRTYGHTAPHMPLPSSLKPVFVAFLDQASRGFPDFGITDEPPPGLRAWPGEHNFRFVPTLPIWPEVYLHMPDRTGKVNAVTLFLSALGAEGTIREEIYLGVDDLSFDVPVPVGTFQEMRPSEPCRTPYLAQPGQCVPPHLPLVADECGGEGDNHRPLTDCEFIHPPSHPASEFAAGGECHKDEHGDRDRRRECGDDHDDDNDDPGEEDHDHDDDGDDHDDHGGSDHGGGAHGENGGDHDEHGGGNHGDGNGGDRGSGHGDGGRGGNPRGR